MSHSQSAQRSAWQQAGLRLALRLAGPGLLIATGAIHLDLYKTGYRTIPTIGPLFLFQVIVCFVLGALIALTGSRLLAALGALFALATLGGYLLSLWTGLFGFREVRTGAGIGAAVIDVAAFAALAALALSPRHGIVRALERWVAPPGTRRARLNQATERLTGNRPLAWAATALSLVALVLLGFALAGAHSTSSAEPTSATGPVQELKTATIGGVTVLTNSQGVTLYLFAPDTPTASKCYGDCAQYWPPVIGTPKAGPGVTGTLGTIRRTDGTSQVTYDGHPLYTYIADSAPGQERGNNLNLNGGLWKVIPVSG